MWSAVVARRLGFISRHELVTRLSPTLGTLERTVRPVIGIEEFSASPPPAG